MITKSTPSLSHATHQHYHIRARGVNHDLLHSTAALPLDGSEKLAGHRARFPSVSNLSNSR